MPFQGDLSLRSVFRRKPAEIPSGTISVHSVHKNVAGIEQIDALYGYAVILTSNDAEAEWLVYETYLRIAQGVDELRGGKSLKSVLLTTLRNLWLDQTQRRHAVSQIGIIDELTANERSGPSSRSDRKTTFAPS